MTNLGYDTIIMYVYVLFFSKYSQQSSKTRSIIGSIIPFRQKWCKFTHFFKKTHKVKNTAKHMLKRLFMIRKRMQKFWLY